MKTFWYNIAAYGYVKAKNEKEVEKKLSNIKVCDLGKENAPLIYPGCEIDAEDASEDFE